MLNLIMKFPDSFTKVTKLSKIIALALFVSLPFLGFYLGMRYQKNLLSFNTSKDKSFRSNYFGIRFNYPEKYNAYSLDANDEDNKAFIFLTEQREDKEKLNRIKDIIECIKDNRQDPSGVCRETAIANLDIVIFESSKQSVVNRCERIEQTNEKALYKCETEDIKGKGKNIYKIILNKKNNLILNIDTYESEIDFEAVNEVYETLRY